ncbi:site-2 protease family protein [Chitinivibrio alkaliphilus]|uniref:Protease, S2P-M50-like family 1 n=1 Tax=Chitinivibrio alkaliphilus ACht1 TaxID=1313304 RepID=U7D6H0_9BACT|nr:site-2 protease family protein [Chitinivibrio alkaliphilus]ERP32114.1 protease, S2P-M50-like family 1 [Chitinivibrio alkaliphilus ACht1]
MDIFTILRIPAILIALTVHEYAHGFVAYKNGDPTAAHAGRLTLNPLPHLSFLGTLMLFFGPIGWAKPVPVQPQLLTSPRKDMVKVALAGPLSNITTAVFVGFGLRAISMGGGAAAASQGMSHLIIFLLLLYIISLGLALFNLLPIAPLDGYTVLTGVLPQQKALTYARYSRELPKIFLVLLLLEWFGYPFFSQLIIRPLFLPWFNLWNTVLLPLEFQRFIQQLLF